MAERQGIPATAVMTTRFASAAELMSRVLGMPDYRFVVIDHPISSASDETLAEYARATVEQARQLLLRSSG
jgi:3-deoxy-D-arabino-heptulosonate 7-phosphate (DAHP) synthase